MIRIFRNIRQKLASENKAASYLRYAIGEILLVVVGILIALQVNNWNELRKQRNKELHYLINLKTDLNLNIAEIDNYITTRNSQIISAKEVVNYFEGQPLADLNMFNRHAVNVYTWQKFFQINNTFQELTNSGNLAIISSDSIKNSLLNLETLYKKLKYEEEHFRYDAEVMLYEPAYGILDINSMVKNLTFQFSNGQQGENVKLSGKDFNQLLKNRKQKNGFAMAVYEFSVMNNQLERMKSLCKKLISLIDQELERG